MLTLAAGLALAAGCGTADDGTGSANDGGGGGDGSVDQSDARVFETVTLTGRVMAPSGEFPISGALVYFTTTAPEPIPSGVYDYECDDMQGKPHTLTNPDGTWSIDVPVGSWDLVTRKGNFRRIRSLDVVTGMESAVPEEQTTLPGATTDDGLDTIPTFGVVKTSPDLTYNLLGKFGMGQVDGSGELIEGSEQFDIYADATGGSYPHTSALFDDQSVLNSYQMIYLPCFSSNVGVAFVNDHVDMLREYVSAGGRIYNSCTVSLWSESAFPTTSISIRVTRQPSLTLAGAQTAPTKPLATFSTTAWAHGSALLLPSRQTAFRSQTATSPSMPPPKLTMAAALKKTTAWLSPTPGSKTTARIQARR